MSNHSMLSVLGGVCWKLSQMERKVHGGGFQFNPMVYPVGEEGGPW